MQPNVTILWDIENVTPAKGAYFTDGLLEMAKKKGPIASAMAFGNWRGNLRKLLGAETEL